jgi:hypothetical protein
MKFTRSCHSQPQDIRKKLSDLYPKAVQGGHSNSSDRAAGTYTIIQKVHDTKFIIQSDYTCELSNAPELNN